MQIFRGSTNIVPPLRHPVLTIGNFDGVHRGHQTIISQVVAAAKTHGGTAAALTFDPHPATVLAPERPFTLLQTIPQRCAALGTSGIDTVIVEPFTTPFAQQGPQTFFYDYLLRRIRPVHIIVGYDFTFGCHRAGRVEHLRSFGAAAGVDVTIVEPYFDGEVLVSSSYIRQCVQEGRVAAAAHALDRPHVVVGTVVRGRGIGKQMGFPTLNIVPTTQCLPPEGVYVTTAEWNGVTAPAATYIGRNPTFGGTTLVIETYLLDGVRDVAVTELAIAFHERLRGDIRFDSPVALQAQIATDVDAAKKFHKGMSLVAGSSFAKAPADKR